MNNLWLVACLLPLAACTEGYIKSNDLESNGQGPSACAKACEEIGMRMTAMVLVGDSVPGCVCQPVTPAPAGIGSPTPPPPAAVSGAEQGAAASAGGYVIIAAQRRQQQQQPLPPQPR